MASTNAGPCLKRRRLDAAARTLNRPFQSPFKGNKRPQDIRSPKTQTLSPQRQEEVAYHSLSSIVAHTIPLARLPDTQHTAASLSTAHFVSKASCQSSGSQSEIVLLKAQVKAARVEIDLLQRALDSRKSGQSVNLHQLIHKWRGIAQAAAEELFPIVKARADALDGGSTSLLVRHAQQPSTSTHDVVHGEEEEEEDYRADRMIYSSRPSGVYDTSVPGGSQISPDSSPQCEQAFDQKDTNAYFTMATMLHYLGIDNSLLKYDDENERWIIQ